VVAGNNHAGNGAIEVLSFAAPVAPVGYLRAADTLVLNKNTDGATVAAALLDENDSVFIGAVGGGNGTQAWAWHRNNSSSSAPCLPTDFLCVSTTQGFDAPPRSVGFSLTGGTATGRVVLRENTSTHALVVAGSSLGHASVVQFGP
jgi:hypothetical protein